MVAGLVLLATVAGISQAQLKPDFGVTGALNLATLAGSDVSGANNLTTFMVGLSAVFPVTNLFAIQPEALYSRNGSSASDALGSGKITIGYFDFPVLAKFSIPTTSAMKPALFVGPSLGLKFTCNIEGTSGGLTESESCDNAGLPVKTLEFGAVGGAGLDYGNVGMFARYEFGLTSIDDSSPPADTKNRVITIGVRYSFKAFRH